MTDTPMEDQPATVARTPTQAGDIRARWAWVEPSVWTERMLTALEQGVEGGKWFSLMDVNQTLRGWFEYFKQSYKTTFPSEDGWLRGRLRRILRQRSGRRGRASGDDHHRWPNRFFAERGLFSLTEAHARACQSSPR